MKDTLCELYGFDLKQREQRLALMGLSDSHHADIEILHQKIIQPYGKNIVDEFYNILLTYPSIKNFLQSYSQAGAIDIESKLKQLKITQLHNLNSYGIGFDTQEYFEDRLRVGLVHAKIGLPISYYQMAFRILNEILFNYAQIHIAEKNENLLLIIKLISNVSTLDMSLAIETYYNIKVSEMSNSIHALMDEQQQLVQQIDRDELTQTASRARALTFLKANIDKSVSNEYRFCTAMIDLDFFKKVNDKYGHLIGDKILKDVSARMMGTLRSDDMLGRYGGEEFILIFPGAEISIAEKIANRICNRVNSEPFQVEKHKINVTVSIGVAEWQGDDEQSLLIRADHALYKAKQQGRNQVVVEYLTRNMRPHSA